MAKCPSCQERIFPFGAPPALKGLGANHVVCPHCETPLTIPVWVFVVPLLLTIPVAVAGHVYMGTAGLVMAVFFVPGPLVLLFYSVEPYGETMLDFGEASRERKSKTGQDRR